MNKLIPLILILSFAICLNIQAQDISGKWVGKLTQGPADGLSRLYDFELNLSQNKKNNLSGQSYAYIPDSLDYRISLFGSLKGDSVTLKEDSLMISRKVVPDGWLLCVKNLILTYHKEGQYEYLRGSWNGEDKDNKAPCEPGDIILARKQEGIQEFLANGGFHVGISVKPVELPIPVFKPVFINTVVTKSNEIDVHHPTLQIRVSDYMNIDDDTVSIYLNRNILTKNARISRKPVILNFKLDTRIDVNEILLYAENLGKIPPNTSLLEIIDGTKTYQIKIEADKQKTAAIYLRYKP